MSTHFEIVDFTTLDIDLEQLKAIAESAFSDETKWFYAEPDSVIDAIGRDRVFRDAEIDHPYVRDHILSRIAVPKGEVYATFYKLPANGGHSPVHVDIESCNILIPLHETSGQAYVEWYDWPHGFDPESLTDEDWKKYDEDWNANPVFRFPENMTAVSTHKWKQGEAILLNTRIPHSSTNHSMVDRINFTINFYDISFAEVQELVKRGALFR